MIRKQFNYMSPKILGAAAALCRITKKTTPMPCHDRACINSRMLAVKKKTALSNDGISRCRRSRTANCKNGEIVTSLWGLWGRIILADAVQKISEKKKFPKEWGVVIASKWFIPKNISLEFIIQHCDLVLFKRWPTAEYLDAPWSQNSNSDLDPTQGDKFIQPLTGILVSWAFLKPFWVDKFIPLGRKNENINVKVFELIFLPVVLFTVFDRGKFEKHLITRRSCHTISPWIVSTRCRWPFKKSARKAHVNLISWLIRGSKRSSRHALPHSPLPIFFLLEINKLYFKGTYYPLVT